ncbi:hypothetical protein EON79_00850 [bacterium]|nr:MAG: hypothetical protein EON79_00850 [bacterium]
MRFSILILAVALLSKVGLFLSIYRGFIDDTYIFARYVDHWLSGIGPDFNAGQPVLGYTSPLYVLLLTAVRLPLQFLNFEAVILVLNLLLFSGAFFAIRKMFVDETKFGLAALVGWSFYFSFLDASINGMETMLFCFLILSYVNAYRDGKRDLGVALAGALMLTRPEGVVIGFLGLVLLLVKGKTAFPWKGLLIAGVSLAAWGAYSMAHYGVLIPQSAVAKSSVTNAGAQAIGPLQIVACLTLGLPSEQITAFGTAPSLVILAVGVVVLGLVAFSTWQLWKKGDAVWLLGGFLLAIVAMYVAGRPLHIWSWYTIPTCMMVWLVLVRRASYLGIEAPKFKQAMAVVSIVLVASIVVGLKARMKRFDILTNGHHALSKIINEDFPASKSILLGDIGIIGYETKRQIVDLAMLVSPELGDRKTGELWSLQRILEEKKPDIVMLYDNPLESATMSQAEVKRVTFLSPEGAAAFKAEYRQIPTPRTIHSVVYVRKEITEESPRASFYKANAISPEPKVSSYDLWKKLPK